MITRDEVGRNAGLSAKCSRSVAVLIITRVRRVLVMGRRGKSGPQLRSRRLDLVPEAVSLERLVVDAKV